MCTVEYYGFVGQLARREAPQLSDRSSLLTVYKRTSKVQPRFHLWCIRGWRVETALFLPALQQNAQHRQLGFGMTSRCYACQAARAYAMKWARGPTLARRSFRGTTPQHIRAPRESRTRGAPHRPTSAVRGCRPLAGHPQHEARLGSRRFPTLARMRGRCAAPRHWYSPSVD